MASVRASVLHRIGHMSFTLHSKGVVYPSGKWLSSSEIHLHTSTISTACTVLHTQAMQCILHGKTVLNNARPPWTVILFIGKKSNEYVPLLVLGRLAPIMLQNLPIMLFGNAAKLCLLCSKYASKFLHEHLPCGFVAFKRDAYTLALDIWPNFRASSLFPRSLLRSRSHC